MLYTIHNSYENFAKSANFEMPDVCIAYNCGFHERTDLRNLFKQGLTSMWTPCLKVLAELKKEVPFIITSFDKEEATGDVKVAKGAGEL